MTASLPSVRLQDLTWQEVAGEKGRRYHDHIVARLVEVIGSMRPYDGPVGSAAS